MLMMTPTRMLMADNFAAPGNNANRATSDETTKKWENPSFQFVRDNDSASSSDLATDYRFVKHHPLFQCIVSKELLHKAILARRTEQNQPGLVGRRFGRSRHKTILCISKSELAQEIEKDQAMQTETDIKFVSNSLDEQRVTSYEIKVKIVHALSEQQHEFAIEENGSLDKLLELLLKEEAWECWSEKISSDDGGLIFHVTTYELDPNSMAQEDNTILSLSRVRWQNLLQYLKRIDRRHWLFCDRYMLIKFQAFLAHGVDDGEILRRAFPHCIPRLRALENVDKVNYKLKCELAQKEIDLLLEYRKEVFFAFLGIFIAILIAAIQLAVTALI
jgi:hypothetical protein